jgi:hypothetical protein
MKAGKSEAERYRSSKMDAPSKVGKDTLKKVKTKPSAMKGGMNSTKGAMKGTQKSK